MPAPALVKRDWQKDHVYLVQFPRAGIIPQASPFALKLETWLRLCDIPYTNVSNEFKKMSAQGKIPFIELNGRQVGDSNFIIEHLKQEFKKDPDANLSDEQKALKTAYMALVENSLFWCIAYTRSRNNDWFASDEGFGFHFTGIKKTLYQKIINPHVLKKKIVSQCFAQGIGRLNQLEMEKIAKDDLDSLESLIGSKDFFFGNSPSSFDCAVFGLLTQFMYTPQLSNEIKDHIEHKCPHLTAFVARVKDIYWQDWDEACKTRALDTKWKKE